MGLKPSRIFLVAYGLVRCLAFVFILFSRTIYPF